MIVENEQESKLFDALLDIALKQGGLQNLDAVLLLRQSKKKGYPQIPQPEPEKAKEPEKVNG